MSPEEVFTRAGTISDCVAGEMQRKGALGLVVVVHGYAIDYPIAIRSSVKDGFGYSSYADCLRHLMWISEARVQAYYATNTGGRSAVEQLKVLADSKRSPRCYGVSQFLSPQWAIDPHAGLIVSVVGNDIDPGDAVAYAETAITKTNEGYLPELTFAATLVYMCLEELKSDLPVDRVAVAMIGMANYPDGAALTCSQSWGKALKFYNFAIVNAKVDAVSRTRKPSGPETESIQGALIKRINDDVGDKIIGAGGLPSGEADVAAINRAVARFQYHS